MAKKKVLATITMRFVELKNNKVTMNNTALYRDKALYDSDGAKTVIEEIGDMVAATMDVIAKNKGVNPKSIRVSFQITE